MKYNIEPGACILVEDNEDHTYLIERCLSKNKNLRLVSSFKSAEDALEYLNSSINLPTVILLDVNLPKMNGFDFLHALKSSPKLQRTPVAMLTSSDAERDRIQANSYEVIRYMIKPLDTEELNELVTDVTAYWTDLESRG